MNPDLVKDLAARAGWTFAQSALGVVVAAGAGWLDLDVWNAAGVAGVAAALAAIKTAISFPLTPTPPGVDASSTNDA
jgi:hypothetical protein